MKAALEVGQTVRIELDGEWYGATVVQVQPEEGRTNWYAAKLEQSSSVAPKGIIVSGLHDTDYVDYDGETVPASLERCSVLLMRGDRGEFGTDTCSIGSGSTLAGAVANTMEHFNSGDTAHFKETPEAMHDFVTTGHWASADNKITYYWKF